MPRDHTGDRQAEVRIGTRQVTIIHRGGRRVVTAGILGRDGSAEEPKRVYLDRLVHCPDQVELGPWKVEGAISTILVASAEDQKRANT